MAKKSFGTKAKEFLIGKNEKIDKIQKFSKSQQTALKKLLSQGLQDLSSQRNQGKYTIKQGQQFAKALQGVLGNKKGLLTGQKTVKLSQDFAGALKNVLGKEKKLIAGKKAIDIGNDLAVKEGKYLKNAKYDQAVNQNNPVDFRNAQNVALEAFDPYEQHAMRQFQQKIVPTIAERFSSLGSGGLGSQRSSAFAAALGGAGSDLASQLGALRAQYGQQQQGINQREQGLGLQQQGLNQNLLSLGQGQQRLGLAQQGVNQGNIGYNQAQQGIGQRQQQLQQGNIGLNQYQQKIGLGQQGQNSGVTNNLLNYGLSPQTENILRPGTSGLLGGVMQTGAQVLGRYIGGGI